MKYLIIGASGFLGCTLYQKLKDLGEKVIGTYGSNPKDDAYIQVELSNPETLIRVYEEEKPEVVIWAAMDPEKEEYIAEKTLKPFVKRLDKCRFVFISTSVAYEKNMSETVTPLIRTNDMYNPHYFNGKILAERIIQTYDNYVIVRPGSIYGIDAYGNYDIRTAVLLQHIQKHEKYVRAKNICFSIVEVNELARAIIELSTNDYVGIINISEEKPVSHYEFYLALCKKYRWDASCVVGNYEKENIYYLDNSLRKKILKTSIGKLI